VRNSTRKGKSILKKKILKKIMRTYFHSVSFSTGLRSVVRARQFFDSFLWNNDSYRVCGLSSHQWNFPLEFLVWQEKTTSLTMKPDWNLKHEVNAVIKSSWRKCESSLVIGRESLINWVHKTQKCADRNH
jgi:hypothetical protein